MVTKKLNLVAPNAEPIVGIKLVDGTLSEFECAYDNATRAFLYVLPNGNAAKVATIGGANVLVDAKGNEWSAPDVEYHSVLHGQR